ncbi:pseudouridine synthase [Alkalicoccus luteus]|uniref:Pseudouridine synthase n=1 Tax=Alkalicoccus luteus TaxID=1237094 RepID=A0A969PMI4_9BACI|nr:pseudouridine synthase [Alkalicoccus luteus]NJP36935.1 rRNA pseudouridine synthase [Alkalicoccus luteus]
MRADKLLANLGYGSRKDVIKLFRQKALTVDGEAVTNGKTHVYPDKQTLEVFGEEVTYKEYIYLMMNKPDGLLSATEDAVQETVVDILEPEDQLFEPFPIGRLDKDTTGLLLLTNDGKLAHRLTSPKHKVDKEYRVHLARPLSAEGEQRLKEGMTLEDGLETQPAQVSRTDDPRVIFLTIQEGKYHQVKRMIAACGSHVEELERVRMGPLVLDEDLERGAYRELTDQELARLKR